MDKEYAGIVGIPDFCSAAARLAFQEDSVVIKDQLVSYCLYFLMWVHDSLFFHVTFKVFCVVNEFIWILK